MTKWEKVIYLCGVKDGILNDREGCFNRAEKAYDLETAIIMMLYPEITEDELNMASNTISKTFYDKVEIEKGN